MEDFKNFKVKGKNKLAIPQNEYDPSLSNANKYLGQNNTIVYVPEQRSWVDGRYVALSGSTMDDSAKIRFPGLRGAGNLEGEMFLDNSGMTLSATVPGLMSSTWSASYGYAGVEVRSPVFDVSPLGLRFPADDAEKEADEPLSLNSHTFATREWCNSSIGRLNDALSNGLSSLSSDLEDKISSVEEDLRGLSAGLSDAVEPLIDEKMKKVSSDIDEVLTDKLNEVSSNLDSQIEGWSENFDGRIGSIEESLQGYATTSYVEEQISPIGERIDALGETVDGFGQDYSTLTSTTLPQMESQLSNYCEGQYVKIQNGTANGLVANGLSVNGSFVAEGISARGDGTIIHARNITADSRIYATEGIYADYGRLGGPGYGIVVDSGYGSTYYLKGDYYTRYGISVDSDETKIMAHGVSGDVVYGNTLSADKFLVKSGGSYEPHGISVDEYRTEIYADNLTADSLSVKKLSGSFGYGSYGLSASENGFDLRAGNLTADHFHTGYSESGYGISVDGYGGSVDSVRVAANVLDASSLGFGYPETRITSWSELTGNLMPLFGNRDVSWWNSTQIANSYGRGLSVDSSDAWFEGEVRGNFRGGQISVDSLADVLVRGIPLDQLLSAFQGWQALVDRVAYLESRLSSNS